MACLPPFTSRVQVYSLARTQCRRVVLCAGQSHSALLACSLRAQVQVWPGGILPEWSAQRRESDRLQIAQASSVRVRVRQAHDSRPYARPFPPRAKLILIECAEELMQLQSGAEILIPSTIFAEEIGVPVATMRRWFNQKAAIEAAAAGGRLRANLFRWRTVAMVIGRLALWSQRAADRVFAPGGAWYCLLAATTLVGK